MTPRRRGARTAGTTARGGPSQGAGADPLAGVERAFVDGNNLLHALGRGRQTGPPGAAGSMTAAAMPASAMVARLRAAFPPTVLIELVFDGPASGGLRGRIATGLRVSYSGRLPADRLIVDGVGAQLAADGPAGTWGILVVTDDRGLRDAVRAAGARVAGTDWLIGRLGRVGPGFGARRPPAAR